jgi:opacity protein-like surface antigen
MLTWAPVNLVVRYQMGQLEPYAGVGMGVFFARVKDRATGESSSSTRVDLNTQGGLRYLVTKHISLFGEWQYNWASFNFPESSPTQATGGIKGDYSAHLLAFGVGYHFCSRPSALHPLLATGRWRGYVERPVTESHVWSTGS